MNTKIIASFLFTMTLGSILLYPSIKDVGADIKPAVDPITHIPPINLLPTVRPKVDVIFALDTTGSMGGLIEAAKEKIWSIATTMSQAQPAPEIRMGLVAYRDRGDEYITKITDLSDDLDSVYATLMDFKAQGGGDGPESVNQALNEAVNNISWSDSNNAYKVIFLVGDAPPHMDYDNDVLYPQSLKQAKAKGIVVNAIQAGNDRSATDYWRNIAQAGYGQYAQVAQDGNAVAVKSPYDEKLATLSRELDGTRLYYGSKEVKEAKRKKVAATVKLHESASVESRARRATFNVSKSGKSNSFGKGELVDDISSGRVELDSLEQESLPAEIQAMAPAKQKAEIKERVLKRKELQSQIAELSSQRNDYLKKKVEEEGGAESSLDYKLFGAIRAQAADKGMSYKDDALAY